MQRAYSASAACGCGRCAPSERGMAALHLPPPLGALATWRACERSALCSCVRACARAPRRGTGVRSFNPPVTAVGVSDWIVCSLSFGTTRTFAGKRRHGRRPTALITEVRASHAPLRHDVIHAPLHSARGLDDWNGAAAFAMHEGTRRSDTRVRLEGNAELVVSARARNRP